MCYFLHTSVRDNRVEIISKANKAPSKPFFGVINFVCFVIMNVMNGAGGLLMDV